MAAPTRAAKACETARGVHIDGGWKGCCGGDAVRHEYFVHGTTVPTGVKIVFDGGFVPSVSGVCGAPGTYFFHMGPDLEDESLKRMWQRTIAGGYNYGCFVICRLTGVVVNATGKTNLVPGAIGHSKDQFCAHLSCISFCGILFDDSQLQDHLASTMETIRPGVTPRHTNSVKRIKQWLEDPANRDASEVREQELTGMVTLQNALVNSASLKPVRPARAAAWTAEPAVPLPSYMHSVVPPLPLQPTVVTQPTPATWQAPWWVPSREQAQQEEWARQQWYPWQHHQQLPMAESPQPTVTQAPTLKFPTWTKQALNLPQPGSARVPAESEPQPGQQPTRVTAPRGRCDMTCDICKDKPCMLKEGHEGSTPRKLKMFGGCRCAKAMRNENCRQGQGQPPRTAQKEKNRSTRPKGTAGRTGVRDPVPDRPTGTDSVTKKRRKCNPSRQSGSTNDDPVSESDTPDFQGCKLMQIGYKLARVGAQERRNFPKEIQYHSQTQSSRPSQPESVSVTESDKPPRR